MDSISCLNCGLSPSRERRFLLRHLGPEIIQRLNHWLPEVEFSDEDFICDPCLNAVQRSLDESEPSQRRFGHQNVCVWCGVSILRTRSNALPINTPERLSIEERIFPRQLPINARVCYACWVAAKRNVQRMARADGGRQTVVKLESSPSTSTSTDIEPILEPVKLEIQLPEVSQIIAPLTPRPVKLTLPNYKRAASSPRYCIYPNCVNKERLRVPKTIRLRVLLDFKLYVPKSARICDEHIRQFNCEEVINQNEFLQTFSAEHTEDMLNLLSNLRSSLKLDFENVETWNSHVCHYWLGYSAENIMQIISECPALRTARNPKVIIGTYLLKLRTGDSNKRLSTLLQTPVTTIARTIKKARKILTQEFLSQHLGLNSVPQQTNQ